MDKLLNEFLTNNKFHENAMAHAKEKGMSIGELTAFQEPITWEILTGMILNNTYHTKVPEIHYINKNTGLPLSYDEAVARNMKEVREIWVMDHLDRVIWNVFYQIYYKEFSPLIHDNCVSYKQKESTITVANKLNKRLSNLKYYSGIKGDLSKFFDTVPIQIIDKQLNEFNKLQPTKLNEIIKEFYHQNFVKINGEVVERYGSLKQGCAFACLLADIILRDIDEEMNKFDVIYYRYSDDFIIIGKDKDKAFKRFVEMLEAKGMKLNDKKTEQITSNQWFTFLGFRFKGKKVTISEKCLKKIRHYIKMQTIVKCKNLKRALTDDEIAKAIDDIQYYLFVGCESHKNGMATYLYGAVNDKHDINRIDEYIKECLMACKTNRCEIYGLGCSYGKHGIVSFNKGKNVGQNRLKAFDIPKELGWYSLNHMYNKFLQGKSVYNMEILKMRNGYIV